MSLFRLGKSNLREIVPTSSLILVVGLSAFLLSSTAARGGIDSDRLYDESASGKEQISEALAVAKGEDKRVIVQFGANWCVWCHRLNQLFRSDESIAAELEGSYVVVRIDVDGDHNQDVEKRYGNPTRFGLPVLIVLEADGTLLTTQETGALEEGAGHSPVKVMAFLKQWAPVKASSTPSPSPVR